MLRTPPEINSYIAFIQDRPLQAGENIQEYRPDLVLLDMRLSRVDGTDICTQLKR